MGQRRDHHGPLEPRLCPCRPARLRRRIGDRLGRVSAERVLGPQTPLRAEVLEPRRESVGRHALRRVRRRLAPDRKLPRLRHGRRRRRRLRVVRHVKRPEVLRAAHRFRGHGEFPAQRLGRDLDDARTGRSRRGLRSGQLFDLRILERAAARSDSRVRHGTLSGWTRPVRSNGVRTALPWRRSPRPN